jgi:hypothetical protein
VACNGLRRWRRVEIVQPAGRLAQQLLRRVGELRHSGESACCLILARSNGEGGERDGALEGDRPELQAAGAGCIGPVAGLALERGLEQVVPEHAAFQESVLAFERREGGEMHK